MSEFVPASELYDVGSRTPIAHPAHQATDTDVRRALEQQEILTDGGNASSDTGHSNFAHELPQSEHSKETSTSPSCSVLSLCTTVLSEQYGQCSCVNVSRDTVRETFVLIPNQLGVSLLLALSLEKRRSLRADTDRDIGHETRAASGQSSNGTDPFTPDGQRIAKGFCETTRSPQTRRKQGRRTHCLYFRFRTVCPSIHRLDTVLDRIETQDTGVIRRRAKKRSVWIEHLLILDEFCSLRAGGNR